MKLTKVIKVTKDISQNTNRRTFMTIIALKSIYKLMKWNEIIDQFW